jgi:hypothetical protein
MPEGERKKRTEEFHRKICSGNTLIAIKSPSGFPFSII